MTIKDKILKPFNDGMLYGDITSILQHVSLYEIDHAFEEISNLLRNGELGIIRDENLIFHAPKIKIRVPPIYHKLHSAK